ncbi:WD40 repeat domain-containing protein [Chthonobacter albigriseus]|uniref:WD40 repeat domain-containing protein n=1 Tax=Chthonobacter albigriseus TaxID=1683161 RepID=UPI0015EE6E62|nr:WD40 repeat domain-containing protein [Chthonobacter albigriseus]
MPAIEPIALSGYIVWAGFVGATPVFASGTGAVTFGTEPRVVTPSGAILAAVRDPDGRSLVIGTDDGKVFRLNDAGESTALADKGRKWIDQVAVGNGGLVAFASGRTAWVREASGKEHELTRPRAVGGLAFFPKGLRLAVAGYGGVGLWYPGTAAAPQELEWKGSHIAVTVSPDGANVVTSMQENALHGWRLRDGQHMRMSGYPAKPKVMSWSAKGRFLATSGAQASIAWPFHFKDGPMGKRPLELGARKEMVTSVACHPVEEIAAIGYDDGMILLVRFSDGEEILLRPPGNGAISALGWDKSGLELAFGTEEGAGGVVNLAA